MTEIKKITKDNLKDIFNINNIYNKNYYYEKQKELFLHNKDINNHSFGIFKDGTLSEYIIAFNTENKNIIEVENFIWKNSKDYILLLKRLFKESNESKYHLFVCDQGFRILQKILDKYFENHFKILEVRKENRYGEILNHVCIEINNY